MARHRSGHPDRRAPTRFLRVVERLSVLSSTFVSHGSTRERFSRIARTRIQLWRLFGRA